MRWPVELTRAVAAERASAKVVAEKYGVSQSGVYAARKFVRREQGGERYDFAQRVWVKVADVPER